MQKCSMLKCNGISNEDTKKEMILDPRTVFLNKQHYNGLLADVSELLKTMTYAFIKGETLSKMAYGKIEARIFSDIDILIPRQAVHRLESALFEKGYKTDLDSLDYRKQRVLCLTGSHQLMPFSKMVKGLKKESIGNFKNNGTE